jgi:hypothetical protein
MDYTKECLYDVEWQKLRVSLLGNSGTEEWVTTLEEYVKDACNNATEFDRRCWRVLNLCNATLLAYGSRQVGDCRRRVKNLRDELQLVYCSLADAFMEWDWDKVGRDLYDLYSMDRESFDAVYSNLQGRVKMSKYKAKMRHEEDNRDGFKHRAELQKFLGLMERVKEIGLQDSRVMFE